MSCSDQWLDRKKIRVLRRKGRVSSPEKDTKKQLRGVAWPVAEDIEADAAVQYNLFCSILVNFYKDDILPCLYVQQLF
jgi:hypothetical protein